MRAGVGGPQSPTDGLRVRNLEEVEGGVAVRVRVLSWSEGDIDIGALSRFGFGRRVACEKGGCEEGT